MSFNHHWEMEYPWMREPATFLEIWTLTEVSITDYNECRPHSSSDYFRPKVFYTNQ